MKRATIILSAVAALVLANSMAYAGNFSASYDPLPPAIDGIRGAGEWGTPYVATMDRADGGGQHDIGLYLQHDGASLFIGVDSQWGRGWDVVWDVFIDGDYSRTLNGSLAEPYVDVNNCRPSPTGYPGYVAYRTLLSPGVNTRVGFGSGAASASGGSGNVFYEFRVPLADLDANVVSGDTIGMFISHGYDGNPVHLYRLSSAGSQATAETWATVQVEAVPEPATLSLLALGGLAMLRRRRR